nr:MAG: hypothetical protein [Circular genetic element sp.]
MATAMTGSFYLTETVTVPAASPFGSRFQGTVDLSSYVNVPTGQAIAIDQVDWIVQDSGTFSQYAGGFLAANGSLSMQLTDLNPGTLLVQADSQSLVASGALNIDQVNNIVSHQADLYPDNFGPSNLSDMFLCVNDTLYVVAGNDNAAVAAGDLRVTCRIRARVVKLSSKNWMAIAIQSTAEA